jgi:calcineurin-like phosphoesterase family protein
MSAKIFAIADFHWGHPNLAKHRGFETSEEHDQFIIDRWNSVVSKHDTVWIAGDISMEKKVYYKRLDELRGIKKVVPGNHDLPQHVPELLKYVNSVCGMYTKMKGLIITHAPIHPDELRGKKNLHGHVHENSIMRENEITHIYEIDPRYINVSCDVIDFTPVEISTLL